MTNDTFEARAREAAEQEMREYIKKVGSFPGPGSIWDHGFEAGAKWGASEKHITIFRTLTDVLIMWSEKNNELKSKLAEVEKALEFYADASGDNWAACRPDDTHETCCHMIGEVSGGKTAREALKKIRGING